VSDGTGNGPIAAFANAPSHRRRRSALRGRRTALPRAKSLSTGTGASALAFIQIKAANGNTGLGAGQHTTSSWIDQAGAQCGEPGRLTNFKLMAKFQIAIRSTQEILHRRSMHRLRLCREVLDLHHSR